MKHVAIAHYIVLLVILLGGVSAFFSVSGDTTMQLAIGILTAISYAFWGIIHHLLQHDLHRRIVVEYFLISSIAIILLATIVRS